MTPRSLADEEGRRGSSPRLQHVKVKVEFSIFEGSYVLFKFQSEYFKL